MTSFDRKVALVTGSTQGLGESTARLFAERGAMGVAITGRNRERGEAVAGSLRDDGVDAIFVASDLSDSASCQQLIADVDAHFGRLDVLVNGAALTVRGSILDTPPELFDQMMAVNARAPFLLTQGAAHIMRREGNGGAVVNISSVAAHGGQEFLTPYSMSKAALWAMTKNVAFSLAPDRIRVNCLNPGWMDSPGEHIIQRRFHNNSQNWLAEAEAQQPFGRLIKTAEAARAIAFLASDESGLMTGAVIDYDQTIAGAGQPVNPGTSPMPDNLTAQLEADA